MAGRSCDKRIPTPRLSVSQTKADISKRAKERPKVKSASDTTKQNTIDIFAQEEQYRILNAELEEKTADLVKQTEQLMREQNKVLSQPLFTLLPSERGDKDDLSLQHSSSQEYKAKVSTKKGGASSSKMALQGKTHKVSLVNDSAAVEDVDDFFLAKTIQSIEDRMQEETAAPKNDMDDPGDNDVTGVSDAQIRVLKAKLRIMQEELDQLTCEYYKKDDENTKLSAKIKELEEDRTRLQRTTSIQQKQIEKHRALAEESTNKCNSLQAQVSALHKEIENQNRSQKQAAAVQGTVEVRLNRALEEGERLKTQLNKMQQTNKDKTSKELESQEKLLTENKMLKKQKAELIVGFKKQLKLIDILKRQKMHFEAAKLLSFTEDEFMKALDWGKS